MLTTAQLLVLKTDILADPVWGTLPHTEDSAEIIAIGYREIAVPDYMVWRDKVTETEYTDNTSAEGTNWSWTAYIARSLQEMNGWTRMFGNPENSINPSKPNVRQGIVDIFSGSTNNAPAQRTHLAAISKKKANRLEKLFAAGAGTVASPSTMAVVGFIDRQTVFFAMGW